jgi:Holliday junction resolvase RusA-like endonuclease
MNFNKNLVFEIRLNIVPEPKQSTKFTRAGFAYTPRNKADYQNAIKQAVMNSKDLPEKPYDCPMMIEIVFGLPLTDSDLSTKKKREFFMWNDKWLFANSKRNDLDNLTKPVADAFNQIVIADDGLIVKSELTKIKVERPFIEIKLYKLSYLGD